jgi:haloacetate dehalogenase
VFAEVNGTRIAYEQTGQGYPMLLVHGYPQTRRMWRRVTPALAGRFSVAAMDLRGYGDSAKPPEEAGYDKRTAAEDILALARHLGWEKFLLVGHDRGARASRRLAADHSQAICGAMLLDILPMEWVYAQGRGYWHWYFMLQRGLAEEMIGRDPRFYASYFFGRARQPLDPADVEHYLEVFSRPGVVEATLADYRTAFEVDRPRWEEDNRAGRKIQTPVYVVWGANGNLGGRPVLDAWRDVAQDVRGEAVSDCSHYIPEEQPEATVGHIFRFADELGLP